MDVVRDILDQCLLWGAGSFFQKDSGSLDDLVAHLQKIPAAASTSAAPIAPSAAS